MELKAWPKQFKKLQNNEDLWEILILKNYCLVETIKTATHLQKSLGLFANIGFDMELSRTDGFPTYFYTYIG